MPVVDDHSTGHRLFAAFVGAVWPGYAQPGFEKLDRGNRNSRILHIRRPKLDDVRRSRPWCPKASRSGKYLRARYTTIVSD